jgi:hypothetical protein
MPAAITNKARFLVELKKSDLKCKGYFFCGAKIGL